MYRIIRRTLLSLIRPLPVAVEWMFTEEVIWAQIYPIAMLCLAVTSIPVHREYFKTSRHIDYIYYKHTVVVMAALFVLVMLVTLSLFSFQIHTIILIVSIFLIEKMYDEELRILNYNKKMKLWEIIQLSRSLWPLPIMFAAIVFDYDYEVSLSQLALVLAIVKVSILIARIDLNISYVNIAIIKILRASIPYATGAIYSGILRQAPRIVVTQIFNELAHLYMFISQCAQIIPVLYNTIYQVPYRKLMSRKTSLYLKVLNDVNLKVMLFSLIVATATIMFEYIGFGVSVSLNLSLLLIAEALINSVKSNYLGCLVWMCDRIEFLKVMLVLSASFSFFLFAIVFSLTHDIFTMSLYQLELCILAATAILLGVVRSKAYSSKENDQ